MSVVKKLIAGNWKMNCCREDGLELAGDLAAKMNALDSEPENFEMLICPPATLLWLAGQEIAKSGIHLGGQDCHFAESGAHTGDLSCRMLSDIGCSHVIVGHSERRSDHNESDSLVAEKAAAAMQSGMTAIICVGEQEADRDEGRENTVVGSQLSASIPNGANAENMVIAYEPVWAIGTGKTATVDDVRAMHAFIRETLSARLADGGKIRILYGGSVKPANAEEILGLDDVGGVLVGGASLKADDFWAIAQATP